MFAAAGATTRDRFRKSVVAQWDTAGGGPEEIDAVWLPLEARVAADWVAPGTRVMVVGCGSGRDLIPFAEQNRDVWGIDPAPQAIARAQDELRRRGLTAHLAVGYAEDLPLDAAFDVVWFSWGMYSFISGSTRRVEVLRHAGAQLAPGGCIVVSGFISRNPPRTRAVHIGNAVSRICRTGWRFEPGDLVGWYARTSELHFEHCFGPGELEREALAAGLEVRETYGRDDLLVLTPPGLFGTRTG